MDSSIITYDGYWTILAKNYKFVLDENGLQFSLDGIKPSAEFGTVIVETTVGQRHKCSLEKYKETEKELKLETFRKSRTLFVKRWDELKLNYFVKDGNLEKNSDDHRDDGTFIAEYQAEVDEEGMQAQEEQHEEVIQSCNDGTERYLIGDCIQVNISNLAEPPAERLARVLDVNHVKSLKSLYRVQKSTFTLFLCNISKSMSVSPKCLKEEASVNVETLGGNHTRVALQELIDEGVEIPTIVNCKLYKGLPNDLALKLSLQHNEGNTFGKQMSAEDMLHLFRRELMRIVKSEGVHHSLNKEDLKSWKTKLTTILGLNSFADLHNRYKVLFNMSKCPDSVWSLLSTVIKMWKNKELKNAPRGEMKVSHLKLISSMAEQDQYRMLNTIIKSCDWKMMGHSKTIEMEKTSESRINEKGKNIIDDQENEKTQRNEIVNSLQDENRRLKDLVNSQEKRIKELESLKILDQKNKEQEMKIIELNKVIRDLKSRIFLSEKRNQDLEETVQAYMYKLADRATPQNDADSEHGSDCSGIDIELNPGTDGNKVAEESSHNVEQGNKTTKRKEVEESRDCNDNTGSSRRKVTKKKKTEEEQEDYEPNENVMAFWRKGKCWYKAKILQRTDCGFTVEYEEDDVREDLPIKFIRKI